MRARESIYMGVKIFCKNQLLKGLKVKLKEDQKEKDQLYIDK